ncbi:MAG TPA: DUF4105 domain-containing protein [Lacipirellulaceae bacterium]
MVPLRDQFGVALVLSAYVLVVGCRSVEKTIQPSHFRDWTPEQAVLPTAEFHGQQVTIRNVRNCQYFANDVYLVDYYDKSFDLGAVRGVDFIIVPFSGMPLLAHTMLSFEIAGETGKSDYLAVSVEVRKEKNEQYNPVKGSARQYELMYVLADERDVIQLRTNFNQEHVFLYRTVATPEAARMLLVDVLGRVNKIAREPEFYDTLTNNCTTNIVSHVNRIRPNRVGPDLRMLLPGYSDQLAFDQGLLERRGTFLETREQAYVNPRAERFAGREDFSTMIRRR